LFTPAAKPEFGNIHLPCGVEVFMRITRAGWLGIVLISIGVILFSGVTDDYKTWVAIILILSGLAVISQRPRIAIAAVASA
jgi:general stress protein CsbA